MLTEKQSEDVNEIIGKISESLIAAVLEYIDDNNLEKFETAVSNSVRWNLAGYERATQAEAIEAFQRGFNKRIHESVHYKPSNS